MLLAAPVNNHPLILSTFEQVMFFACFWQPLKAVNSTNFGRNENNEFGVFIRYYFVAENNIMQTKRIKLWNFVECIGI